jgi:addiction module RelB/DinJ family antitoxin
MRVEKQLKRDAESILKSLGLNLSDGINIFLHRLVATRGIPFPVTQARADAVGQEAADFEAAFGQVARAAVADQTAAGLPIARFDPDLRRPYLQWPDGRKDYNLAQ